MTITAEKVKIAQTFFDADWNEYARCYDALMYLTPYRRTINKVATDVLFGPKGYILDASCGTGNFEMIFSGLENAKSFPVIGIDTSKEMLARAKQKCAEFGSVTFAEANLNQALPFPSGTFSQVVSINTLYAVKDPEVTLREFHRVLIPQGKLHLVTPKYGYENGEMLRDHARSTKPSEYWKEVHKSAEREELLIREAIKNESLVSDMLTVARHNRAIASNDVVFHFFQKVELVDLLKQIGFVIQEISLVSSDQDIFITAKKGI
jgi:ubiquinone/menaquinone biosynthesis C-methylase UbiE